MTRSINLYYAPQVVEHRNRYEEDKLTYPFATLVVYDTANKEVYEFTDQNDMDAATGGPIDFQYDVPRDLVKPNVHRENFIFFQTRGEQITRRELDRELARLDSDTATHVVRAYNIFKGTRGAQRPRLTVVKTTATPASRTHHY